MGKKAPVVLQISDTECGVASLAMLFAYYKAYIPLEELRDKCGISRDGCKAQTLINVAHEYGFEATAYQLELDTLKKLNSPVIAHWKFSHYIVVNYIAKDKIFINDPAFGEQVVSLEEFGQAFTGIIINITPKNIKLHKAHRECRLKPFFSKQYHNLLFIVFCLLIANVSSVFNLIIYRNIIDSNINDSILLALSIVLSVITLTTTFFYKLSLNRLTTKTGVFHLSSIVTHLIKLPFLFYSLRQRSEVIAILSRTETFIHTFYKSISNIVVTTIGLFICGFLMIMIDSRLCLSYLILTALFIIFNLSLSKTELLHEKSITYKSAKLFSYCITSLKNIETIKSCAMEEVTLKKWRLFFFDSHIAQEKMNHLNSVTLSLTKAYHVFSIFLLLLLGSSLSPSKLISYYTLHFLFYNCLNSTLIAYKEIQNSDGHFSRIRDLYLYKTDHRYNIKLNPAIAIAPSSEIISCSNVSFYYNVHEKATLKNINIKIYKNQFIAIVGKTGSGKSTLAKLLCALYQPTDGILNLYGNNILDYSAETLAKLCSYVSQETTLFSGTLLYNLTLGHSYSTEELNHAIRTACLSPFIEDRGLSAIVEESGRNFSGGEKQRMDIARAILQNTPIIILDEATSSLDTETESKIMANLRKLEKTIVFVTHRASTITFFDQVIRLNNGEIS